MDNTDHSPDSCSTLETMQRIREAIWSRRPILGEIMKKHGNKSLYEYAKDFMDVNPTPSLDARKHELFSTVHELLKNRLGERVASEVCDQLKALPLVSTADHHGPIDHPFWVNSNIISALPFLAQNDPVFRYLVVFSFASVSVNNASAYPRGILFHGHDNGEGPIIRLPIIPDKEKMAVVYGMRSYTGDELEKTKAQLVKKHQSGEVTHERTLKIYSILEEYFGNDEVLKAEDLDSQITKINFKMWPQLFKKTADDQSANVPDLIYLEIETIATELLLRYHLNNPASIIYKLLFDKEYQASVKELFNNIPGAFSVENDWGTYMFWAIDDKHHRVRMFLDDEMLHSTFGMHKYAMTPEGITEGLKKKELFPSMILCYILVSLYYGMKCLGGFCQVNDLTVTKQAWQALLKKHGKVEEAEAVNPVQTKELGGDGMVLSYVEDEHNNIVPATGIDMMVSEFNASLTDYATLSKHVSLTEIMNPMLPEMYTVLYPQPEREEQLVKVTVEEIVKATKLKDRIQPDKELTSKEKVNYSVL